MAVNKETDREVIHTRIWNEEPQAENPFVAEKCFCAGFDVYGEILKKANWFEYVYLLFTQERPEKWQAELLEKIAIAIANPGIRDHSVRAAMNAGVGGSTSASTLMAALATGAGQLGGAREVFASVTFWQTCKQDLQKWKEALNDLDKKEVDGWPAMEHPPGFDPNGVSCATPVKQLMSVCAEVKEAENTRWLQHNRAELESMANMPLAVTGVTSAVLHDIGFSADQSEMLFLLLRLPGAAVHALEQRELGWKKYPFYLNKYFVK